MIKIFTLVVTMFLVTSFAQHNNLEKEINTGNVIFMHPDGTALSNWLAMRTLYYGPDSQSNWDKLPTMAIYSPHTKNSLTPSSNAGATMHSYGKKVDYHSYGMDGIKPLTALSGKPMSIMQEAKSNGILTGIINSGHIIEPGTGVFVSSSTSRQNTSEISKKIVQSGTDLIFSGGEDYLLPIGTKGRYSEGKREDGLNLIEWAKDQGYTIVYNNDELKATSPKVEKILGVFAAGHTFNDKSEEELIELGLSNFNPEAPTLAEMTSFALDFFDSKGQQFYIVIEEEATDNFGNHTNASGMLEALKRADDAIGIVSEFVDNNKNTMLITAADSEAGGMEIIGNDFLKDSLSVPEKDKTGAMYDGRLGTATLPFKSKPDKFGNSHNFVVAWSTSYDVCGAVVARAKGLNEHLMFGSIQNTDIYRFMYATLFGKLLEKE